MRSVCSYYCLTLTFLVITISSVSQASVPDKPIAATKPSAESTPSSPTTWAKIELKGSYAEGAQMPGLFGSVSESLSEGISRLEKAATDKTISGVILRFNSPTLGWAKQNEFRQAIKRIQAKGKKVYAYLDSGTSKDYLIASACDKIIMPESGVLMVLGMQAEVTFYKNLFDTIGVKADMLRVGEFKSAAEPYTRTEMSDPFYKEMEELLDDYYRQIVDVIAQGRNLDRKKIIAAIDSGPHTAADAKKMGLIDEVAYEDALEQIITANGKLDPVKTVRGYGKKKLDTDFSGFAGMMKLMNLMMGIEPTGRRGFGPKIAVIHANGMIVTGRSTSDMFSGEVLGSETFIKAVHKAEKDSSVKAIVLRVDSPGGSALASDLMWRALQKVKKPVVVSMGDVAASGGYYISMGANRIFAEPGTLTGSIGVVGGKFALKGLYEKVGISTTVIRRGKNSGVMSVLDKFSDSERKAMTKMLHEVYAQFTTKAAEGRKMKHAKLEKLARGRVYTGAMAVKIGLVDELGTLEDAFSHAKKLAGIKPEEKVDRIILPRPSSPFEQLFGPVDLDARSSTSAANGTMQLLQALSPELATHLKGVAIVNLLARESRLTLMPFRITVK
jgi:protease-4